MASLFSSFPRLSLGLLLGCLLGSIPLQAQLDTRLQAGKTDFMNLYQQATSTNAKPEIVTVFDYSGSMASLMFHPLYRNDDKADADAYRNMRFVLTNGTPGTPTAPNNRYRIRAYDSTCTGAQADYIVTVTSSGATGVANTTAASCPATVPTTYNTAPTYRIQVRADGNTNAYARASFTPTANGNNPSYSIGSYTSTGLQNNTNGAFTVTFTPTSGTHGNGTTVTLTSLLVHPPPPVTEPPTANITGQTWSISTIANAPATGGSNPNTYVTSLPAPVVTSLGGNRYQSVTTFTIPAWTAWTDPGSAGNPTRLQPVKVESPGTPSAGVGPTGIAQAFSSGATLTLNTWYHTKGSGNRINWTVTGLDTTNQSCSAIGAISPTYTTDNTTSEQHPGKSVTWTIPAWQDPATCTLPGAPAGDSYVTITLEASQSGFAYPGITYVGTLSGNTKSTSTARSNGGSSSMGWLIKPDGTAVTVTDAAGADAGSGLRGASYGSTDVRNWIRAASHVRFRYRVSSLPDVFRTIDIPMPWKITTRDSTGNPLTSQTMLDQQLKAGLDIDGNPITTTYGSGTQIELDRNYRIEGQARGVLTSNGYSSSNWNPSGSALGTGAVTTAWLYSVVYKPSYISWLFTGKYQGSNASSPNYTTDSSLVGKYVVFDAASTTNVAGQTNVSWGQGYGPTGTWGNMQVPRYNLDGTYRDSIAAEASSYKIPALTRIQAVKGAAIQTWISHQADVFWAFRCLDPFTEASNGSATTISNDSTTTISASDATTTHVDGNDTGWMVLNNTSAQGITSSSGNSVTGMNRIASLFTRGGTPLTYAMARALAQYSDPDSVFNAVVGTDVSQCVSHYLLLFTDGVDNNGTSDNNDNATTPYIAGAGTVADPLRLSALSGNQAILAGKTRLDRNGSNWNLFTFAGVAAHMADATIGSVAGTDHMAAPDPGASATSGVPSTFLPYAIKKRNGVTYDKDHRITTMTVGVSLGGQYTETDSPKRSLFLAAVVGDQATKTGELETFHSFFGWDQPLGETLDPNNDWIPDPQDPTSYPKVGKRADGAVFFFDATDPDKLSRGLDYAFRLAIGTGGNNATASPNLPFVGASLGKQVYLGSFQPPKTGGVLWPGDLFMFGTRETGGSISIIDKKGDVATVIDKSTAIWATSDVLLGRSWKDRKLYTRLPGGTALRPFKAAGADFTAMAPYIANLKVPAWSTGELQTMVQSAMGADTAGAKDGDGLPVNNRANIMGDIINSAPAALEYKLTDSTIAAGIAASSRLSAVADGERFRIILVGSNQGWLHAFGEVTKTTTIQDSEGKDQSIITGAVDELWSFMPTDFLKDLDYVYGPTSGTNSHKFMVDGTPAIYLLDLPPATGGSGNGWLDYDSDVTKSERGIAIIGLRKGGRSYYALDIRDPFNPTLKWSLVPDESASLPATRNLTKPTVALADLQTIVADMGFSSSTPATARIAFDGKLRDAVFLGGGLSVPEVETNFLKDGKTIPLGRSVMALDVYTGEMLSAVDLTKVPYGTTVYGNPTTCSVGPVAAGLVPFEFFLNSGMAQRAYFIDYAGGLWSWGSKATPGATDATYGAYKDYRVDSSDLAKWTAGSSGTAPGIRKVYHDGSASKNWLYSTLPAPFRVGYFRGVGKGGSASPSAVGIAMVSGDRNNPLDYEYAAGTKPSQHRLTVVFDRQDSRAWGLDTQDGPDAGISDGRLADFTDKTATTATTTPCTDSVMKDITPGCADYFLAPKKADGSPDEANTKFGYYVNFPAAKILGTETPSAFVSKGINYPTVISGSLFYTYFEPTTADPCTGGTGVSHSMLISDVFQPLVKDNRSGIANPSGELAKWSGVASDYIAVGTRGVIQGGTVALANPIPGGVQTTIEIKNLQGSAKARYPKARVWRTVQ